MLRILVTLCAILALVLAVTAYERAQWYASGGLVTMFGRIACDVNTFIETGDQVAYTLFGEVSP